MNILLLTKYFPPEPGAGSTRAYEHARRWVKSGANVTVLTCFPHYPNGIIPEKYKGMNYLEENIEGIKVIRTYTYATANKGKVKRSIGFISFMFSSVIQGASKIGKQDIIVASSPPITVGVSALALSKIKKIPYVFEARDLWPESIVQLGQITNKFIIGLLEKLEILLYKNSSFIVGISDPFVKIIASKGIPAAKIKIIKNGVDINFFSPIPKDENLQSELNLKDKFIVSYFGTFGLSHSLDKVLLAAEKIKDKKEIHFLLIGDGAEREKLIEMKSELQLTNVTILPSVTREQLKNYYSISDLMLVTLRGLDLFSSALPSKMFEIMAMGKPILHTVDGVARELLDKEEIGKFVEPENSDKMANAILELYKNHSWLVNAGNKARNFVIENFNRDLLAQNYLRELEKIIK